MTWLNATWLNVTWLNVTWPQLKRRVALCTLLGILALASGCVSTPTSAPSAISANPAVLSLVERARGNAYSGHYLEAQANLERALRIEPTNAGLWYQLAQTLMQQGEFNRAENLALRANSFAGGDRSLQHAIWQLIGDARQSRGDFSGASQAYDKAAGY